jgi:uncharacterized membrane protein
MPTMLAMKYTYRVDIDAPAETVWAVWADVPTWSAWTKTVASAGWVGDSGLEVGHKVRLRAPALQSSVWKITEVDPGRSFTWETRSPILSIAAGHVIVPRDTGVTVELSADFTGVFAPLVGAVNSMLGRRYQEIEANGLKGRCEGTIS